MKTRGWDVRGHRDWMSHAEEVMITYDGQVVRFVLEDFPAGSAPQPTIGGTDQTREWLEGADGVTFLRAALNAAWELGLRPDGFDDTRESMRATERHLQDMRAIAFGKLGVEKP